MARPSPAALSPGSAARPPACLSPPLRLPLFPASRLALGRRIRVFSGGGRTAVRTGLLAACSRPRMALRRRHLCFFCPANPTFATGLSLPAPRYRPGPLPRSLAFLNGPPAGPAAAPRARREPRTAPKTVDAPALCPFARGWVRGLGKLDCGKPLVGNLPPGAIGGPGSRLAAGSPRPARRLKRDPN